MSTHEPIYTIESNIGILHEQTKQKLRQTYERYIFKFVLDNFLFIFKKNIGTTELVYVGSIPTLGIHLYWLVQSGQFSLVAPH